MKIVHIVAFLLTIVGALNWGLVGLGWLVGGGADWNIVHMLLNSVDTTMQLEGIVYILVGLSAVALVFTHKNDCKACV